MDLIEEGVQYGFDLSMRPIFYLKLLEKHYAHWKQSHLLKEFFDIGLYYDLSDEHFEEVRIGLLQGINILPYTEGLCVTNLELKYIRKGLLEGIDVSLFANKEYNSLQIKQIYRAIKSGVDIIPYIKYIDDNNLYIVRTCLEENITLPSIDIVQRLTSRELIEIYTDGKTKNLI